MNYQDSKQYEIMAPVGSYESLAAAIEAGADSVYFGVGRLNMRSHSANHFDIGDLRQIVAICTEHGIKTYLTVNTIIYDNDLATMREILDAAREAGVSAIIASDVAVMSYCRQIGLEVHLSTQLNISNVEALRFYAQFADVAVLARELNMDQVRHIYEAIHGPEPILGPAGQPVRIEMFCHGALCMAVSGKCYMSLMAQDRSANRGECVQICRRSYLLTDRETGNAIEADHEYLMSPKDLKTIRFIDKMMKAGVRVFKIEGRARGAEYVLNVVRCYKEAIQSVLDGTYTEEKKDAWDERLAAVFNRGFWEGYYAGRPVVEHSPAYGSSATQRKVYVGKVTNFYRKLSVAEVSVEAAPLAVGEPIFFLGATTGVAEQTLTELHGPDGQPAESVAQGELCAIRTPGVVRRGDQLYKFVPAETT